MKNQTLKNQTLLAPATTVADAGSKSHYFSTTPKEVSLQSKGADTFFGTLAQVHTGTSQLLFAFSASEIGSKPAVVFPYTVKKK